jgi:hypothetical protein
MSDISLLKEPSMSTVAKKVIQVKSTSQNTLKTGNRKAPHSAFKPGRSGNPGGRPKLTAEQKAQEFELVQACRSKSPQAIAVIEQLMHRADRDSVRLAAASFIVERGWGKAPQAIEHSSKDEETSPRSIQVTFVSPNGVSLERHEL